MDRLEITSSVNADPERVWRHACSVEGIGFELGPWLHMTVPRGLDPELFDQLVRGEVAVPRALGRSWVLLFGVLPFDWDDMVIAEVGPGRRFLERSSTASFRAWQHERVIDALPAGGTSVTDRLGWEPRAALLRAPARRIVGAIFQHRHARLRARFA
jgi:ligand-binding SRPBCC domain-containing protein